MDKFSENQSYAAAFAKKYVFNASNLSTKSYASLSCCNVDAEAFCQQRFLLLATLKSNCYWSEAVRIKKLSALLLGLSVDYLAKALAAGFSDETPFDTFCYQLANLFANVHTLRDALQQLNARKLRQDESITSLVNDLERLTTVAFPTIDEANNDDLVIHNLT